MRHFLFFRMEELYNLERNLLENGIHDLWQAYIAGDLDLLNVSHHGKHTRKGLWLF